MSVSEAAQPGIRIAAVTDPRDFQQCVAVQVEVWGYSEGDVIPKRVFVMARAIGLVGHIREELDEPLSGEIWSRLDEESSGR